MGVKILVAVYITEVVNKQAVSNRFDIPVLTMVILLNVNVFMLASITLVVQAF